MDNTKQGTAMKKFADSINFVSSHTKAKPFADFSMDPGKGGVSSVADRGIQAGILSNFAKIMDSEKAQQITMSPDYGPYVMDLWPVVTAWYPEFPLKDLISVQDMDKPLAYLFLSRLKTGTGKAPTGVGDVVETPYGSRTIHGSYPTGEIRKEVIPAAQTEFDGTGGTKTTTALLHYYPIDITRDNLERIQISVKHSSPASNFVLKAHSVNASGKVVFTRDSGTTIQDHTLDLETGEFVFVEDGSAVETSFTELWVNYVWNIEHADETNIPRIKEDIEMIPIEAQPRALMMSWTLFAEYLKKTQFGTDVREDNTRRILNLLYQYQTRYILDRLYDEYTGGDKTVTIPDGTAIALDVKSASVMMQLKTAGETVRTNSGRMEMNRIITGTTLKNFLETLPTTLFQPAPENKAFDGPRELGTYGSYKVYFDPALAAGEAYGTYRGPEWYDAAFYMGVYMPVVPTDAIALAVTVRQSFVAMEAYKFHKKNCVIKIGVSVA